MPVTTAAFVGATGGAGTTRTTLEVAALLAADGRSVAVLDAAYATQGLGRYLDGRLDPDVTTLVTDAVEAPLRDGLVEVDLPFHDSAGRVACCPAYAPFERLARAKTAAAAQAFETRIAEAAADFDHVLVDTPPVAANQAVAAVTAVDRVAVITPGTSHGVDAAQRTRSRLQDLQTTADAVVAVGADGHADLTVPETTRPFPAVLDDRGVEEAAAHVVEVALEVDLEVERSSDGLRDRLASLTR